MRMGIKAHDMNTEDSKSSPTTQMILYYPRADGMEVEWEVLPKLSLPASLRLWSLTLSITSHIFGSLC